MKLRAERKFSALPGPLGGLAGTFYFRDSAVEIPGRTGERLPLAQTPRQEVQVSLTYERGKCYASLDYSHAGRTLQVAGRQAAEDTWYFPIATLGASFSYQLRPEVRLFADFTNLGEQSLSDEYYGTPARPGGLRFEPGRTARIGAKLSR